MFDISVFFKEYGYYYVKGVFQLEEVVVFENDFDGIVCQFVVSGEVIDVIWDGGEMDKIVQMGDMILYIYNVQKYLCMWFNVFLNQWFLDVVEVILGLDIILYYLKFF